MGLYIPYRGTLTEPVHDVANKRITTIVTAVTAETDLPDLMVSFDQLSFHFQLSSAHIPLSQSSDHVQTPELFA